MTNKLFEGRVVIVTGAGGGIGRSHALAYAKEGAKVVVNDLGSSIDGSGETQKMADKVVEEIKARGGTAVANYDSVSTMEGAKNIIKTAIDNFSQIDVLINNAGILRDKTLLKMTEDMWDIVIAVHLKGTYACTYAAAPYMKEKGYGRIINTTSFAGLMGNFGQANYSAAKAGIYGFTRTVSLELEKYNVLVNAIAPLAKTRMTEDVEAISAEFKPEQITPMVMYLGSEKCESTGKIFGIHGHQLFEYKMISNLGLEKTSTWPVTEIHEKLDEIMKFESPAASGESVDLKNLIPKLNQVLAEVGLQVTSAGAPGATPSTPTEVTLSDMFQKMNEVFLPDKAGDFKGLIQFEVSGDKPQAIYIEGGKITIKAEKGSSPACTITTDKTTMIDVFKGKIDINKAFMKGKVKADKMPVLMKFGNMLALNKLPALISAQEKPSKTEGKTQTEKPSAAAVIGSLKGYMLRFSEVFNPNKADSDTKIKFSISGDEDYAFVIQNKAVTIKAESIDSPDLTITTDKETMVSMLSGELHPNKAFMKRKLKADKMPMLMKFNNMFNIEKLGDILKAEIEEEKASAPAPGEGMNRDFIGKKYFGSAEHVKPETAKAYAKATNAANKAYYKDDLNELAIHPIFPVSLMKGPMEKLLLEDDLNMDVLRMVHGGHRIKYFRPLNTWDLIYTVAEIKEIASVSSGEILNVTIKGINKGRDVYEMTGTFFVRGKSKKKEKGEKKQEPEPTGNKIFSEKMKVDPDQSKRYAAASGDDNPIHLDPETAKAAGLPDIILHGLCTMAFCSQAIVEKAAGGDPRKLEDISVRFSKYVLMNDELTTTGWLEKEENGRKYISFETTNKKGEKVISQGKAVVLT